MNTKTHIQDLLITIAASLSLTACGGGGGGGGGNDTADNPANNGTTTNGKNDKDNEESGDYAPTRLTGYKLESDGGKKLTFANSVCTYYENSQTSYSGSYTYSKTGKNKGTLWFKLYYNDAFVDMVYQADGLIDMDFSKGTNTVYVQFDGRTACWVENSINASTGQAHYYNFNGLYKVKN